MSSVSQRTTRQQAAALGHESSTDFERFVKGDFKEAFLFAIAVAVGLTPEMLPMVVTANLAKGAVAMAKQKVIVKRLARTRLFGLQIVIIQIEPIRGL